MMACRVVKVSLKLMVRLAMRALLQAEASRTVARLVTLVAMRVGEK